MKRFFQRLSLGNRILLGYFLLLIMFLCPTILFYLKSVDTTIRFQAASMEQLNRQLSLNIDVLLEPLDRVNMIQYSDGTLRNILLTNGSKKDSTRRFQDDLYMRNALNHAFRSSSMILRGQVINKYGDSYSNLTWDSDVYPGYSEILALSGDPYATFYTGVHETSIQLAKYRIITMFQGLYYYNGYLGMIIVDLNYDTFLDRFNKAYTGDSLSSLCVLSESETIYRSPGASLSEELENEETHSFLWESARSIHESKEENRIVEIGGKKYLICVSENQKTGWMLLQYVPMSVLNEAGFNGIKNLLAIAFIVLILASVISVFLSRQLIRPLNRILADMKFSSSGHLRLMEIPEHMKRNEIGMLISNYNAMAKQINADIDATYLYELNNKQMQLKMLRYQINPHFMYNTLNTISALAEIRGEEDIVLTTQSLSKILHYNVKGEDVVNIQDELEYVRSYLQIQDIRFPGRFFTSIEVEEKVKNCAMLKFLIQPILENSISHGLRDRRVDARIEIKARTLSDTLLITVYDNGSGMPREEWEKWNQKFARSPLGKLSEDSGEDGIGLLNVNMRIKNFYGPEYGLEIYSEEGEYTKVTLRLKAMQDTKARLSDKGGKP